MLSLKNLDLFIESCCKDQNFFKNRFLKTRDSLKVNLYHFTKQIKKTNAQTVVSMNKFQG